MTTELKSLQDLLVPGESFLDSEWQLQAFKNDQCLSYVAWNEKTQEGLIVDPKQDDLEAYRAQVKKLEGYRWVAVFDTHTHADHISCAAQLAEEVQAPLLMHVQSPSQRVHIRICKDTTFPSQAGGLQFLLTPGHTPDGVTLVWGPFLFTGDTVLYGDTGRDDLPGGDAEAHFESLQKIKAFAKPDTLFLPGHDHKGGRASSWKTQLKINSSLTQAREDFVREASAFEAPAPQLLKESLRENFK